MNVDALETLLLRELQQAWRQHNLTLFSGGMRSPTITLSDGLHTLGQWQRGTRTLSMSRHLLAQHSWSVVMEVLKHEMAHQYVDEVLQVHTETAHGPAFQRTCQRRGIDPAASGLPDANGHSPRIVRKIQRLLALAESPNPHEARTALRTAQRMMLRYNLDLTTTTPQYGFRQIGRPLPRRAKHHKLLAGILTEHFFVSAIWIHAVDAQTGARGRALEIHGTPTNLEIALWVHDYLLETAERLWRAHRRVGGEGTRGRYLAGIMLGVQERLNEQRQHSESTGLIWTGDADLTAYMQRRHPRQRTTRSTVIHMDRGLADGMDAGRQISLHRPVKARPGPRLLTARKKRSP